MTRETVSFSVFSNSSSSSDVTTTTTAAAATATYTECYGHFCGTVSHRQG